MSFGPNVLYYGDNLDVLQRYVADESIDLVYLDPPFNSNATYNVLFHEHDDTPAAAQIEAFEDTWKWDIHAAQSLYGTIEKVGGRVADALMAFEKLMPESDMLAYLAMMAPRLVELQRVLKPTGSLYLHCDPNASHYLKILLDAIFAPMNFRSEIVWQRSHAHSDTAQGRAAPGRVHDTLLFYTKGGDWTWNPIYTPYSDAYVARRFVHVDSSGRRYKDADLTAAKPGGDTQYEWRARRPVGESWESDLDDEWRAPKEGWEYLGVLPSHGRYWAYSKENMRRFAEEGKIHYFSPGTPRLKQYADEMQGISLQDIWIDIPPINSQAQERLGFPTQKPQALLERIIKASSNEGDTVLDPFCGCGTAVVAAQKLKRYWIGIDVTHLAVGLIKYRLADSYGLKGGKDYEVVGEPTDLAGAEQLAQENPWQFQAWALGLVGARTATSVKKGADRGIDGRLFFEDEQAASRKQVILSVKAGNLHRNHVHELRGVVEREKAEIGVLISFKEPTKPMREEAASAGFYHSPGWNTSHPHIQLLTVAQLLDGKQINYPHMTGTTFKKAPKAEPEGPEALTLDLEP